MYRATQMKRKRKWEKKSVLADAFSTRYLRFFLFFLFFLADAFSIRYLRCSFSFFFPGFICAQVSALCL